MSQQNSNSHTSISQGVSPSVLASLEKGSVVRGKLTGRRNDKGFYILLLAQVDGRDDISTGVTAYMYENHALPNTNLSKGEVLDNLVILYNDGNPQNPRVTVSQSWGWVNNHMLHHKGGFVDGIVCEEVFFKDTENQSGVRVLLPCGLKVFIPERQSPPLVNSAVRVKLKQMALPSMEQKWGTLLGQIVSIVTGGTKSISSVSDKTSTPRDTNSNADVVDYAHGDKGKKRNNRGHHQGKGYDDGSPTVRPTKGRQNERHASRVVSLHDQWLAQRASDKAQNALSSRVTEYLGSLAGKLVGGWWDFPPGSPGLTPCKGGYNINMGMQHVDGGSGQGNDIEVRGFLPASEVSDEPFDLAVLAGEKPILVVTGLKDDVFVLSYKRARLAFCEREGDPLQAEVTDVLYKDPLAKNKIPIGRLVKVLHDSFEHPLFSTTGLLYAAASTPWVYALEAGDRFKVRYASAPTSPQAVFQVVDSDVDDLKRIAEMRRKARQSACLAGKPGSKKRKKK